jgi:hypothetical protein
MSISQNFPAISPTLNLNFARSKKLDPRITFTRSSSATRTNAQGLIEVVSANTPRFEHSVVGVGSTVTSVQSLGLLIEASRTNLQVYSGISSSFWSANNSAVVTNNSSTSPDGTTNATQIAGAALIGSGIFRTLSLTSGTVYTYSLFVKAVSGSNTIYFGTDTGTSATVQVNTSTGVASLNFGSPTNVTSTAYPNGWYRIGFTFTAGTTATHSFVIYNLTANLNTWLAWGAQVEAGSFATSYIPTVASTVTRSADNASMTGTNFSSWYNQSEGTLFAASRINALGRATYPGIAYVDDGTNANSMGFVISDAAIDNLGAEGYVSNINQYYYSSTSAVTPNQLMKIITAYKSNDFASASNVGSNAVQTDTSGSVPTVNRLIIGDLRGNSAKLNGTISQLTYYPRRLTNSQLQNLTK